MSMEPQRCECGHTSGQHRCVAPLATAIQIGVCLVATCRCRTFAEASTTAAQPTEMAA